MNWEQLQAIIWLRWRLTRNQFLRGGQLNRVLALVLGVLLVTGGLGLGVAGTAAGVWAGVRAPAPVLLLIWDGVLFAFLVFWFSGVMVEIQRSESVDLTKLLHLPVTLRQVFLFNYVVAHANLTLTLLLPGMLGLAFGVGFGGSPRLLLCVPLLLSFVFALTSWTYCLRGWLAALMINKRRRRAIIVWVTVVFVALCQVPNLAFNSRYFRQHTQSQAQPTGGARAFEIPEQVLAAHVIVPPGWVGYGAMALRQGNMWPALGAILAGTLIGGWGLARAYRLTIRFYQGAGESGGLAPVAAPAASDKRIARRRLMVERGLPGMGEDTAALAWASLRALSRAPELKMALVMPLVAVAALVFVSFKKSGLSVSPGMGGMLVAWSAVFAAFTLAPMMSNTFGLERNGFRVLVLVPTPRHRILLGKNLSFLPFVAGVGLIVLSVLKIVLHVFWLDWLSGWFQLAAAFLLFSLACNLISVLAPYRLSANTFQAKKPKPVVFLAALLSILCLPLMVLPITIAPLLELVWKFVGGAAWVPVNLLASVTLLGLSAWLYRALLPLEGRLLERRELTILREVTEEVE